MDNTQIEAVKQTGAYREVSKRVDDWLPFHVGETFDMDLLCRHLEITSAEGRKAVSTKLSNLLYTTVLVKENKIYRYVNKNKHVIQWENADTNAVVDLKWPYGIEDESRFGFDGHIIIPQRSVIICAGVTNTGKTAFALNFLLMNCDDHQCLLMGNEYEPSQFKRRMDYMQKINYPFKENGSAKFEVVERHQDWQDIIEPDAINIIDWLNLSDNFYQIGKIIDQIKEKLNKGVCFINLQKNAGRDMGTGGDFGTHLATMYLSMDFGRITVKKAKEWNGHNPNGEVYGFDLVEHGSQFHNIRDIVMCRKCWGKTGNTKCELCYGTGWIDKEEK